MNIAIVLSGGSGSRMKLDIPKQYIRVKGNMLITYSLKTLMEHAQIDGICIVAEQKWQKEILDDLEGCCSKEKIKGFALPGKTRQYSILNGLEEVNHWEDICAENIVIHDAARPNVSPEMIADCINALKEHDGAMPVLPMKDTIYFSENGNTVSGLLDRGKLFAGQAPESFRFLPYYNANKALLPDKLETINGSTEPAVLAGMDIAMISGDENNFKVTTQADLERFRGKE
uniref:IspD/TarI family cytidylyltransferase n=1 Tax=Agathobacter sp. TaxID=2021311 RepID=UPI0040560BA6